MGVMQSFHIHIQGQVQGVGFRPFVYQIALEAGLNGWVNNAPDGVHIELTTSYEEALNFLEVLKARAPALACITAASIQEVPLVLHKDFKIVPSDRGVSPSLLLTPDFALCASCREELKNSSNRRFQYPFITCLSCGPRYSILCKLPYDRLLTSMRTFEMCAFCGEEYSNPLDRRYFSQTNSCEKCGIDLQWFDPAGGLQGGASGPLLDRAVDWLRQGKILAVKGLGGFLLCTDASNEAAILSLRARKHRSRKPFAVMYPSLEALRNDTILGAEEAMALLGASAPIVILPLRSEIQSGLASEALAPQLLQIGAMIPYAPLFELILSRFGKPVVATSGNLSDAPIIYEDHTAITELAQIADGILLHNRQIVTPLDDSVMRYTPFKSKRIILRRSRGLAPAFILPDLHLPSHTTLAMGAMMKSTFAIAHKKNIYLSQYLGDLENYDTERSFRTVMNHLLGLLDAHPEIILTDLHPDYFSTRFGEQMSADFELPLKRIQHHEAHFAAVLAENGCLDADYPILGVIWDGTGLGHDGQIWGGEFFRFEKGQIHRVEHLSYFPFILGDKMPREPRISALSACIHLPDAEPLLHPLFTRTEWSLYQKLLARPYGLQTSSMGRLFDAAAALLGFSTRSSYEGEAAMYLEQAATIIFRRAGLRGVAPFELNEYSDGRFSPTVLLDGIVKGVKSGIEPELLAARFHITLVSWIAAQARRQRIRHIAFSGGVFQNALLTDLCTEMLEPEFKCLYHNALSPNDENIAFGQLMHSIGICQEKS